MLQALMQHFGAIATRARVRVSTFPPFCPPCSCRPYPCMHVYVCACILMYMRSWRRRRPPASPGVACGKGSAGRIGIPVCRNPILPSDNTWACRGAPPAPWTDVYEYIVCQSADYNLNECVRVCTCMCICTHIIARRYSGSSRTARRVQSGQRGVGRVDVGSISGQFAP